MFLGVAETIVSSLLCCGVGIVQCLFNLLYYVIGVRNTKKPPVSREFLCFSSGVFQILESVLFQDNLRWHFILLEG